MGYLCIICTHVKAYFIPSRHGNYDNGLGSTPGTSFVTREQFMDYTVQIALIFISLSFPVIHVYSIPMKIIPVNTNTMKVIDFDIR